MPGHQPLIGASRDEIEFLGAAQTHGRELQRHHALMLKEISQGIAESLKTLTGYEKDLISWARGNP